ncbi:MAG: hypothetical protein JJT82_10400 [Legionellaceae bacterium]|nr:hypothetical protein [Legionellaceae bacterium]
MNKSITATLAALLLIGTSAHANWVCNVTDAKEQQYTFTAPEEDDAEKIASTVCTTFGIQSKDCLPDCYDTGVKKSRWHCVVSNKKEETWSFLTPKKAQGMQLAQSVCDSHKISKADCQPLCVPE